MPRPHQDVLVAEDRPEIRDLVVAALSGDDTFQVQGCSIGLEDTLPAIEAFDPDALVFGSCTRNGGESEVLQGIRTARPNLPVVLFSPHFVPGTPAVRQALALGGCTRLPCTASRYAPATLADLVRDSLAPWIRKVVLKPSTDPQAPGASGLHLELPSPADIRFVRELVRKRTAIVIEPGRDFLVQVRLAPLAKHRGFDSISELVRDLRKQDFGDLHRAVIDAMLSNQSSFFRDAALFRALRESVIPELLLLRSEERRLTAWTAACSTGQEAYSLAMFLSEYFPVLSSWSVRIIASDSSSGALKKARDGRYDDLEVSRGVPIQMLGRFFERRGGGWIVSPALRKEIEFLQLVLAEPWPELPELDLVVLREVFLYLEEKARNSLLERMRERIRPGGFLVLGRSDPALDDEGFENVDLGPVPAYRRVV